MAGTEHWSVPYLAVADEALMVRACQPGAEGPAAFSELVRRHERDHRRMAARICSETHADEAVQEASISLWRSRESYRSDIASPAAWMMHFVKLRSIDVLRRQGRHDARRYSESHMEPAVACDAVEVVHHRMTIRFIIDALANLPHAQQQAVLLHHGAGLSQPEVAAHTGVALGTTKGRLRLGHAALRRVAIA